MNYIKSIKKFLENDVDVKTYTTNVHFVRVDKNNKTMPLIIFSELWKDNVYWKQIWAKGIDYFVVMFECIVKYEDTIIGREMRELLKFKLNWFSWLLTADWSWWITRLKDEQLHYDSDKDIIRFASTYLFKNTYDYTTKRTEL